MRSTSWWWLLAGGVLAAAGCRNALEDDKSGVVVVVPGETDVVDPPDPDEIDFDGDRYPLAQDCNDNDVNINPGVPEVPYDGVDNDCNAATLDDDLDGDGFLGSAGAAAFDCDDLVATTFPGAAEACDGVDNNCDQQIDESLTAIWYLDGDGDGFGDDDVNTVTCAPGLGYVSVAGDCDDLQRDVFPGATEVCNGIDDDCDLAIDAEAVDALPFYADADLDGYGDPNGLQLACALPAGFVTDSTDCDDTRLTVHPSSPEVCNGLDDDCNAVIDDNLTNALTFYVDGDGDGWGDLGRPVEACAAPPGTVDQAGDCDDTNGNASPTTLEACDGYDNNCDTRVDEDNAVGATAYHADVDRDGYGDPAAVTLACAQPAGTLLDNTDCNDAIPTVYPGALELCDGYDNDCDGTVDENATQLGTWYADDDGDGFGRTNDTLVACINPPGFAAAPNDCNDNAATVRPGAPEICDGLDNDCDGFGDEAGATGGPTWYLDADNDQYGSNLISLSQCAAPPGFVGQNGDCDDIRPQTNPGASEVCDGRDNDCDAVVDDSPIDLSSFWTDADRDGFGASGAPTQACAAPSGFVANGDDCDDADARVRPGAFEVCNGVDDDCNRVVDDNPLNPNSYFSDVDGDGYGDAGSVVRSCALAPGWVANDDDCDDANSAANPGADEVCGGVDEDCDGRVDEGDAIDAQSWYADADRDGFGNANRPTVACMMPAGSVADGTDCDDTRATTNPLGAEVCDGLDNDCDLQVDEGAGGLSWYEDADRDGYGDPAVSVTSCVQPAGYVRDGSDCDDANALVSPARSEICDGVDNDCDGGVDDNAVDAQVWAADADGDRYGDRNVLFLSCTLPAGYVGNSNDCDDTRADINPRRAEVCNGLDDNCDGFADTGAVDAVVNYVDADADGFGDTNLAVISCVAAPGVSAEPGDCDDADGLVFPGATEVCNGGDDDCDGFTDELGAVGGSAAWRDADRDGHGDPAVEVVSCGATPGYVALADDCNDALAIVYTGAPELCDGLDNDCNSLVDDNVVGNGTWYFDGDQDGVGSSANTLSTCSPPEGYVAAGGDCDDANPAAYPGSQERCDGFDNDCNGFSDENTAVDAATWYADLDGDAYGRPGLSQRACSAPSGFVPDRTDCNDGSAVSYPGAVEICDGLDNDCDLLVDDSATDPGTWYVDVDRDGFGAGAGVQACAAPSGYVANAGDCDDSRSAVRPGGVEVCNGLDDDCSGAADDGAVNPRTFYADADGDNWGAAASTLEACVAPAGYVTRSGDCDDTRASDRPGGTEVCDTRDNDCDGAADDSAVDALTWYLDVDRDTFGNVNAPRVACTQPAGAVANDLDCADNVASINPNATEVCNGRDDDCDGAVDDGATGASTWSADADGDGFGNGAVQLGACSQPLGYVRNTLDCDDANASTGPGAPELCDGLDNDCDLIVDEGALGSGTWYADEDLDGFGDQTVSVFTCSPPSGYVDNGLDCDDSSDLANPDGFEVCDGLDNDCDGGTDTNAADATMYHRDADQDGYGLENATLLSCSTPAGYTVSGGPYDCADNLATVYPGAAERCDGQDNDCNGLVDDGNVSTATWYRDLDQDGFGSAGTSVSTCSPPAGYVLDGRDCNDGAASIFPGAAEVCDGVDQDCDGATDEGAADALTWYADADGDGFGIGATTRACVLPPGYAGASGDCNDAAATVYPGAAEVCDSLDQDCDGVADDSAVNAVAFYRDADADGYGNADFSRLACTAPVGFIVNGTDCQDASATINPGAPEICDGVDNNCNTLIDDGVTQLLSFYIDGDGDGYGGSAGSVQACVNPGGYVARGGDCNDVAPAINPGALEYCDTVDNDCDGGTDEAPAVDAITWYQDADGDRYGNNGRALAACAQPVGYVGDNTDCNDLFATDNPAGTERCDSRDNDCDAVTDEPSAVDAPTWYRDVDGDTYGTSAVTLVQCAQPAGYANRALDCDDARFAVNPAAIEICDNLDNNCNGITDGAEATNATAWFRDADNDTYGNQAIVQYACTRPAGYVLDATDCNDATSSVRPGATETCNGIDDNCSGTRDETAGICPYPVYNFNGHSYFFATGALAWTQARDYCTARGYYLISVNSLDETYWADGISDSYANNRWWTGMNDLAREGTWTWVGGQPVTFTNWRAGEPNNVYNNVLRQDEDCMQFNRYGDGTWNDEWCSQAFPFICEAGN